MRFLCVRHCFVRQVRTVPFALRRLPPEQWDGCVCNPFWNTFRTHHRPLATRSLNSRPRGHDNLVTSIRSNDSGSCSELVGLVVRQILVYCGSFWTAYGRSSTYCLLDGVPRVTREPDHVPMLWTLSIHAFRFFQHHMLSNRLLVATRTRQGLKWGVPAILAGGSYANVCTILIDRGAPEWLHLVVLWGIWNAFKFVLNDPVSLFRLVRAVTRERTIIRVERPQDRGWVPPLQAAELPFLSRRRGRPLGRIATPLTCDRSTHGLRVHLEPAAQLHERPAGLVQSGGLLGLCRVQTCAAHGDAAAGEMGCRGEAVDVELLGHPAQGRSGLVVSDQLVDFDVGEKSLSHPK